MKRDIFKNLEKQFYIVEKNVLPEVILKVVEAKNLLEQGKAKTIQEAVHKMGISRSAFYKYKESVFLFYENIRGRTVTIAINLLDTAGILSNVLNVLANGKANILTINQTIPLGGIANVTLTIETGKIISNMGTLLDEVRNIEGVQALKILASE